MLAIKRTVCDSSNLRVRRALPLPVFVVLSFMGSMLFVTATELRASSTPLSINGKISYGVAGSGIFTINEDGSESSQVIRFGADQAVLSPDGSQVVYRLGGDYNSQLWIANSDGSQQRSIDASRNVHKAFPTWSPDGSKIAFLSGRVMVMEVATGESFPLTDDLHPPSTDIPISWAPSGDRVLFTMSNCGTPLCESWQSDLITVDFGGNYVNLTNGRLANGGAHYPSWSPDGTQILFSSGGEICPSGDASCYSWNSISVIDSDGTNRRDLLVENPGGRDLPSGYVMDPVWSPDGGKIAFLWMLSTNCSDELACRQEVWTMNSDGSDRVQVTSQPMVLPRLSWARAVEDDPNGVVRSYVPVTPTRFLDTRDGRDGPKYSNGETRTLQIAGRDPVPALTAVAVTLNVTVTEPDGSGYLTVWPSASQMPLASNLNFIAGQTVPNMVTVGLGTDGAIEIFTQSSAHIIVDVVGYFYAGFNPVSPIRVMDTRSGQGGIALGPGETRDLVVTGQGGVPGADVGAVALNVTVTEPTSAGYVTVWPTGVSNPLASNLNFTAGQTVPNAVIVGVGAGGKVSLLNSSGTTQLIVDVSGWFSSGFNPRTPTRVMDTREGKGGTVLGPGQTRTLRVAGVGGVPASGAGGVSLNVTVTEPTGSGYLTVWPTGKPQPLASNLNFTPGKTIPNSVISGVGPAGEISIFNSSGNTQVIVDIMGWFKVTDSEAPNVRAITVSPDPVDTSTGPATVNISTRLTDNQSGVSGSTKSFATYVSPSGNATIKAYFSSSLNLVSGSTNDGVFETDLVLPEGAEQGTWRLAYFDLFDQVGNTKRVDGWELTSNLINGDINQIGLGDGVGPQLVAFDLDQATVDTTSGDQEIVATMHVTDSGSGSKIRRIGYIDTYGRKTRYVDLWERISGDDNDGIFRGTISIPASFYQGGYSLFVELEDRAGNRTTIGGQSLSNSGFPIQFIKYGDGDGTPPTVTSITASPTLIHTTNGPQAVTIQVAISDAGAGAEPPRMKLRSPTGRQILSCDGLFSMTNNDPRAAIYICELEIPGQSELGNWTLFDGSFSDSNGNSFDWRAGTDFTSHGFAIGIVNS
jgi:Tol biopolymer transport system component